MNIDKIGGVYLYHWRTHHKPWPGFVVGMADGSHPHGTRRATFYLRGVRFKQGQRNHFLRIAHAR